MEPVEEVPEEEVPERVEDLEEVASSAAFGEFSWSTGIAATSEGGLRAEPS